MLIHLMHISGPTVRYCARTKAMIIAPESLSAEALQNLIEQFVLREGTEYGEQDVSLAEKVAQVRQLLKQGQVLILYSQLHETVDIVPADAFDQ